MPLFDKMKAQASQVAAKAQEAGKAGQAKIEQAQAKRQGDDLLRRLGATVYAERTGKPPVSGEESVDELVAAIAAHESEHGPVDVSGADPVGAGGGPAAPAGDFKLD